MKYDFDKALSLWEKRLDEVKSTGKVSSRNGSLFHSKFTEEDKTQYIESMIQKIKDDKARFTISQNS